MKNISVIVVSTLLIGAIAFLSSASVSPKAKATVEVCFCHNINNNPETICTDNAGLINGHDGHVDSGMDTLGQCAAPTSTPTPTPTPTPTATPTPEECHGEGAHACPTPTPTTEPTATPTPEVTQAPGNPGNPGGPGDGRSDGRSDGKSSCPDCTKAQSGQVLGATTDFAGTGVAEDMIMNAVGVLGGISTAVGLVLKKKLNK